MVGHKTLRVLAVTTAVLLLVLAARRAASAELREYPSRYYVIYTDHDEATVKEAQARLTAMAEEYHRRTKDYAGTIRTRLPFYLFSRIEDYHAAGGVGAGIYAGRLLMAHLPKGGSSRVWHVVQHEGFHQFAAKVIRGGLPVWVNEGLAEYFGEGVWTGDNFVTGMIPGDRLARVQALIRAGKIKPFMTMLMLSHMEWRNELSMVNYDQAWSMVHFLVHAEDGKYRKAFDAFILDMSKGVDWPDAFLKRFGRDVEAFQKKYSDWWLSLPADAGSERRTLAVVQTLTSFLARAHAEGQTFETVDAFFEAARADRLRIPEKHWLPPALLAENLNLARRLATWSLENSPAGPRLVLKLADGDIFTGTLKVLGDKGFKVDVEVGDPRKKPAERERPGRFELP
ncbi:MAG TPA: DUF1570 domain-containing protein [Planctomycetota bacterium]|nr:DUF1570 domain-containing protein [Planctomycetota bacterium]